ncbi:MAG: RNA-binding protein [Kiloniellaceae bacterium]
MAVAAARSGVAGRAKRRRGADAGAWRRCIASGDVRPKAALIRFVAAPDGTVVPDLSARLPGRGLWLSPGRDMIQAACDRNLFAKAAKAPLRAPDDLAEQVERLLLRRCIDLLGLARRAGQVVRGFDRVAARVAEGKVGLVLQAADGAEGGRRKLRVMARARDPALPIVALFSARQLGQALGEGACVHVAVAPGRLAERLREEAARLAALRGVAERSDEV